MLQFSSFLIVSEADQTTRLGAIESVDNSIRLQGVEPRRISDGEVYGLAKAAKSEVVHVCDFRSVFMPGFYEAASVLLESHRSDYAFCQHVSFVGREKCSGLMVGGLYVGQLVVRPWVFREVGGLDLLKAFERAIGEYRGVEVPYPFCVEVFR